MNKVRIIIKKFGGISGLSKALGHRHASTVQGWWERAVIPFREINNVINAGKKIGLFLEPNDFFDFQNDNDEPDEKVPA